MPILTFTNGRKKYVLRRISTSTLINKGVQYPTATDDGPIVGLDPDLEYLAMDQDLIPDYDPRIYSLVTNEAREEGSPPTWRITFDTAKRSITEIKVAITNAEAVENQKAVGSQELLKLAIMGMGILFRKTKGLSLNAKEEAVMTRLTEAYATFDRHDAKVAEKFAVVDANQIPDIDSWEDAP